MMNSQNPLMDFLIKISRNIPINYPMLYVFLLIIKFLPWVIITHDLNITSKFKGVSFFLRYATLIPFLSLMKLNNSVNLIYITIIVSLSLVSFMIIVSFVLIYSSFKVNYFKISNTQKIIVDVNSYLIFIVYYILNQYIYSIIIETICDCYKNTESNLLFYLIIIICVYLSVLILIISIFTEKLLFSKFFKNPSPIIASMLNSSDYDLTIWSWLQVLVSWEINIKLSKAIIIKNIARSIYALIYLKKIWNPNTIYVRYYIDFIINFIQSLCFVSCLIEWIFMYESANDFTVWINNSSKIILKIIVEIGWALLLNILRYKRMKKRIVKLVKSFSSKDVSINNCDIIHFFNYIYHQDDKEFIKELFNEHINEFLIESPLRTTNKNNNKNANLNNSHNEKNYDNTFMTIFEEKENYLNDLAYRSLTDCLLKTKFKTFYSFWKNMLLDCLNKNNHSWKREQFNTLIYIIIVFYYTFDDNIAKCLYFIEVIKHNNIVNKYNSFWFNFDWMRMKNFLCVENKNKMRQKVEAFADIIESKKTKKIQKSQMNFKYLKNILISITILNNTINSFLTIFKIIKIKHVINFSQLVVLWKDFYRYMKDAKLIIPRILEKSLGYDEIGIFLKKFIVYEKFFYNIQTMKLEGKLRKIFRPNYNWNRTKSNYVMILNAVMMNGTELKYSISYISDNWIKKLKYNNVESKYIPIQNLFPKSFYQAYCNTLNTSIRKGKRVITIENVVFLDSNFYANWFDMKISQIYSNSGLNWFVLLKEASNGGVINNGNADNESMIIVNKKGKIISVSTRFRKWFNLNIEIIRNMRLNIKSILGLQCLNHEDGVMELTLNNIYENILNINSSILYNLSSKTQVDEEVFLMLSFKWREVINSLHIANYSLMCHIKYKKITLNISKDHQKEFYIFDWNIYNSSRFKKESDEYANYSFYDLNIQENNWQNGIDIIVDIFNTKGSKNIEWLWNKNNSSNKTQTVLGESFRKKETLNIKESINYNNINELSNSCCKNEILTKSKDIKKDLYFKIEQILEISAKYLYLFYNIKLMKNNEIYKIFDGLSDSTKSKDNWMKHRHLQIKNKNLIFRNYNEFINVPAKNMKSSYHESNNLGSSLVNSTNASRKNNMNSLITRQDIMSNSKEHHSVVFLPSQMMNANNSAKMNSSSSNLMMECPNIFENLPSLTPKNRYLILSGFISIIIAILILSVWKIQELCFQRENFFTFNKWMNLKIVLTAIISNVLNMQIIGNSLLQPETFTSKSFDSYWSGLLENNIDFNIIMSDYLKYLNRHIVNLDPYFMSIQNLTFTTMSREGYKTQSTMTSHDITYVSIWIRNFEDSQPVSLLYNNSNSYLIVDYPIKDADYYWYNSYVSVVENYWTVFNYFITEKINAFFMLILSKDVQKLITIGYAIVVFVVGFLLLNGIALIWFLNLSKSLYAKYFTCYNYILFFSSYLEKKLNIMKTYIEKSNYFDPKKQRSNTHNKSRERENFQRICWNYNLNQKVLLVNDINEDEMLNKLWTEHYENITMVKILPFKAEYSSEYMKRTVQGEKCDTLIGEVNCKSDVDKTTNKQDSLFVPYKKWNSTSRKPLINSRKTEITKSKNKYNNSGIISPNNSWNNSNKINWVNSPNLSNSPINKKVSVVSFHNCNYSSSSKVTLNQNTPKSLLDKSWNVTTEWNITTNTSNFLTKSVGISSNHGFKLLPESNLFLFLQISLPFLLLLCLGVSVVHLITTYNTVSSIKEICSWEAITINYISNLSYMILTYITSVLKNKEISFDYTNSEYINNCQVEERNYVNGTITLNLFDNLLQCNPYLQAKFKSILIENPEFNHIDEVQKYLSSISDKDFCANYVKYYIQHSQGNDEDILHFFPQSDWNEEQWIEECENVGNGFNSNGIDMTLDSIYTTVTSWYSDFIKDEQRNETGNYMRWNDENWKMWRNEQTFVLQRLWYSIYFAFYQDLRKFDFSTSLMTYFLFIAQVFMLVVITLFYIYSTGVFIFEEEISEFVSQSLINMILF